MRHLSCCASCVLVVLCLKSMTLACNDSFSLKLNFSNNIIQLKESDISSIQICSNSSPIKQEKNSKSSNETFIVSCTVLRQSNNQSVFCNKSARFEKCLTGVHLIHSKYPGILVAFENMTIQCLNSGILSFKNCNVIGDDGEPISQFEIIIIASCSSVSLFVIIILIFICIVKNYLKVKPSQRAAQITPENDFMQIESKPLDHASSDKFITNNDTITLLLPTTSEINDNFKSPETPPMKIADNVSSLDTSGNAQVSIMQDNNAVDIRSRLSIEPPAVASSQEVDIELIDESNVYSLIDTDGGDGGLQVSAREPLSLPQPRRQIDVDTADGTTRNDVNDARDVYSFLGEEIRDFQNPYNETPEDMNCKMRESYDERRQYHLAGSEWNKSPKLCVAEANDVYSRLGQEIKEFDNTYNITPNEKVAPSSNQ